LILFPYKNDNPTRSFPFINWFLIGLNLWVYFAWQFPHTLAESEVFFSSFGFIPSMFFEQLSNFSIETIVWEWGTVFTSMFSHGGFFHLLGNMLFLYLYGNNVEEAMGKLWYLLFYLSCGLLAALAQALTNPDSGVPMVGASGAISGVVAGYLLLYPKANVRVFYWIIFLVGTIYIPAYLVLGWWFIQQVLAFPESMKAASGVAVAAHLGGFAAGLALTPLTKKKGIKLFQGRQSLPFARNR
jgi:membrane associated rhomboid family serine protease